MESARTLTDWMRADPELRARWRSDSRRLAAGVGADHGVFVTILDDPPFEAGGELDGIPFAVKDNIDIAGIVTTAGSTALDPAPAQIDAGTVSVLRASGAYPLGKTNMHELAFGLTSNNARFGPVRNPLNPSRSAGGSSGGSAAAVALGVVPFSLGTDTGGSVTVPAAFCAVVGFRPSTGRYPGDGLVNLSWTRDTVGVHTGSVQDARIVDSLIARSARRCGATDVRGLRIGVLTERLGDTDPAVEATVSHTLRRLERAGAVLVDVGLDADRALAETAGMTVVRYEAARLLPRHRGTNMDPLAGIAERIASADVRAIIEGMASSPVSPAEYADARRGVWSLRRAYAQALAKRAVDVLAGPACAALAPLIGDDYALVHRGESRPLFATLTRNTSPGTLAGVPMLSLPAGRASDGSAVGILLEGAVFDDRRLLGHGEAVERVLAATV